MKELYIVLSREEYINKRHQPYRYIFITLEEKKERKTKINSITNQDRHWWEVRRLLKIHWSKRNKVR